MVVRSIDENRWRIEVVKSVLKGGIEIGKSASFTKKISLTKNPQLGVSLMKGLGASLRANRVKADDSNESRLVDEYERELRRCDAFIRFLIKDIVNWTQLMQKSQAQLLTWAINVGKAVGISHSRPREAHDAFLDLMNERLIPLCQNLLNTMGNEVLLELTKLLGTIRAPHTLLAAMLSLEPSHHSVHSSKSLKHQSSSDPLRPSQKYLAIRDQLASELPAYLQLLNGGIILCIYRFIRRQADFLKAVHREWREFWDSLRMDGETLYGGEETVAVWWNKFSKVEGLLNKLSILRLDTECHKAARERTLTFSSPSSSHAGPGLARLAFMKSKDSLRLRALAHVGSPAMYRVTTVQELDPSEEAMYGGLPFFRLRAGNVFDVLSELGYPNKIRHSCANTNDGDEDCLLVVRNEKGDVGLALASFLIPLD